MTGAELTFSEANDAVRIETGDGVGRELCRRALAKFLGTKPVRDHKAMLESLRRTLEREIIENGTKALKRLRLKPTSDTIVDWLGKLNWRTSYTQNQYKHSIEAGYLAGIMASELQLSSKIAPTRRGAS